MPLIHHLESLSNCAPDSWKRSSGLSDGALAGVIVAAVGVAVLFAIAVFLVIRIYRHRKRNPRPVPQESIAPSREDPPVLQKPLPPVRETRETRPNLASSSSNAHMLVAPAPAQPRHSPTGPFQPGIMLSYHPYQTPSPHIEVPESPLETQTAHRAPMPRMTKPPRTPYQHDPRLPRVAGGPSPLELRHQRTRSSPRPAVRNVPVGGPTGQRAPVSYGQAV